MAGTANSITSHNSLRGVLNANNVIAGRVGTAFDSTYSIIAETGAQIALSISSTDYKMQATLKDKYGNIIYTSNIIDLPLETMVVNARYDKNTKEVVLILDNGNELRFSVADLVEGLVSTDQLNSTLTDYVKFTDYATNSKSGVIKINSYYGTNLNTGVGVLYAEAVTYENYQNVLTNNAFISKGTLENVITGKELVNKTYVDEADAVFEDKLFGDDNVEGSGTELIIDNTTEAPMKIVYKGNTYQYSTSGKNLLGLSDETKTNGGITGVSSNGEITLNNTATSTGNLYFTFNFTFQANTTYSISANNPVANSNIIIRFDSNVAPFILTNVNQTNTFSFENDTTITTLCIRITSGTTLTNFKIKPQLEKGGPTSYEPYTNGASPNPDYPQPIQVVSGDNSIEVCGKNLFSGWTKGKGIRAATGEIIDNTTGAISDYILVNFNTNPNYYISGLDVHLTSFIAAYNSSNQFLGRTGESARSEIGLATYSFTSGTPQGTGDIAYIIVYQYKQPSDTGSIDNLDTMPTQLEIGSQATSYEPYTGASYPINLPEGMELCKIGTYQDKIFKNTPNTTDYDSNLEDNSWYLKKEIGKVVLNGSENWKNWAFTSDTFYGAFLDNYVNYDNSSSGVSKGFSNYFEVVANGMPIQQNIGLRQAGDDLRRIYCVVYKTIASTVTDFKTWLSTHNTTLYYVLSTPTYTLIEGTLASQLEAIKISYENQTNISQINNDLPFELNISAVSGILSGIKLLLEAKEDKSNKVAIINKYSTDEQYPTAKCVYDLVGNVETLLEVLDIGSGARELE